MIPLSCAAVYLIKIYWERLYRPVERLTAKDFLAPNPPHLVAELK